jgi:general stress protein YciG
MSAKRGLGSDKIPESRKREIRSEGGKNSPSKFETGSQRTRDAGRRGGSSS